MNTAKLKHIIKTAVLLVATMGLMVSYQSCAQWIGASSHGADNASSAPVAVVPFSQAEPILALHCAGCHSPSSGNAAAIAAISDITNPSVVQSSSFVVMGSPQTSTLYLDIIDNVMPQNLPPNGTASTLSAGEIETVREWLLAQNIATDVLSGSLPPTSGAGAGGGGSGPVSFKSQIAPIISANCAGCHGPNPPTLTTEAQISANASAILTAVTTTTAGLAMPPGAPLTGSDVALIKSWVQAGAPNN